VVLGKGLVHHSPHALVSWAVCQCHLWMHVSPLLADLVTVAAWAKIATEDMQKNNTYIYIYIIYYIIYTYIQCMTSHCWMDAAFQSCIGIIANRNILFRRFVIQLFNDFPQGAYIDKQCGQWAIFRIWVVTFTIYMAARKNTEPYMTETWAI